MRAIRAVAVILILLGLSYAYLYPGSEALLEGRTDIVMSDDTDPANLPYFYDQILKIRNESPSDLLYGAVYLRAGDPERGLPYWMSWNERLAVLIGSPFTPIEQLPTFVVMLFIILSGLAMYILARSWNWGFCISMGLSLSWAFCAYTRARAKVHNAFTGTYHLPLIFVALTLIASQRNRRSLVAAALCLLTASTVSYYYILSTLFLSPLFLLFLLADRNWRSEWKIIFSRLTLAVLPSLLFLGLSFTFALAPGSRIQRAEALPKTGEAPGWDVHPFLDWYAARPGDYLSGDLSLESRGADWNPLRQMVNESILSDLGYGNAHERTNGIRWIILFFAALAIASCALPHFREKFEPRERAFILFFSIFLAAAFWLSLSPKMFSPWLSPAYWLHSVFSQVRVPSRAGIVVHFCSLILAGLLLNALARRSSRGTWLIALFPVLVIADYPPVGEMPMAKMREAYTNLQRSSGACEVGLYFPYIHPEYTSVAFYHFQQKLRGSDCQYLNGLLSPQRSQWLWQRFPATPEFVKSLPTNLTARIQLLKVARCVPLNFIVFAPAVPQDWAADVCRELGWALSPDGSCVAQKKNRQLQRYPDECGF